MNEHDKVMTGNCAERFVDHRSASVGPERVSEFPLHHGKRRFDVRPLVVVGKKFLLVEHLVGFEAEGTNEGNVTS